MKILGIGVDLVTNSRIGQRMAKNYSQNFIHKFLHEKELLFLEDISNERQKVEYLSSRWAVKSALNKAMGINELQFKSINIEKDIHGRPIAIIAGDENQRLLLQKQISRWHISYSHQVDYTIAIAVVEQFCP